MVKVIHLSVHVKLELAVAFPHDIASLVTMLAERHGVLHVQDLLDPGHQESRMHFATDTTDAA